MHARMGIPSLSSRKKWYWSQKNLQIGDHDIVLLVSSENPRAHWPLGRVIARRKDGYVCSVKLQVGDKQFVRPIMKLCPL